MVIAGATITATGTLKTMRPTGSENYEASWDRLISIYRIPLKIIYLCT